MNADLALARLAEAATAHDGHAHDRDQERHCLLPGHAAQAPAAPAAAEELLSDGGYDLSRAALPVRLAWAGGATGEAGTAAGCGIGRVDQRAHRQRPGA
jgi:hypothetical protein